MGGIPPFLTSAADRWAADRGMTQMRTTPLRVVLFGDSQANVASTSVIPDNQDISKSYADVWNSGGKTLRLQARKWQLNSYYPQAWLVGNCGISGSSTFAMLQRDAAAASATRRALKDAIDLDPDVIVYRGGSINNLASVATATDLAARVADAISQNTEILRRMLLANVPVLVTGIYGYSSTTMYAGNPLLIRSGIVQINAALKAICAGNPNMLAYIDPVGTVSDADGNFLDPRMFVDTGAGDNGVHVSGWGGNRMASLEAAALAKWFGRSVNRRYRGKNLYADPLLIAEAAQTYGKTYGGLTCTATNATMANAKLEYIDGKRFQTVEITATAGGGSGEIRIPFNPTASGLNVAIGETYGIEFDYYLEALTHNPTLRNEFLRVDFANSVGGGMVSLEQAMLDGSNQARQLPATPIKRHIVHQPILIGANGADLTAASRWYCNVTLGEIGDKVKIGVAAPSIVKL